MDRIEAHYHVRASGDDVDALARAIAVELTVEVPEALIARFPELERSVVARVESREAISPDLHALRLSFDPSLASGGLPQLLNLLSGNVSMLPGVELVDVDLPDAISAAFPGPRYGIEGIRARLGVYDRPLVSTALKPRGAPVDHLVAVAEAFAEGGGEIVKDDHNLVDPDFDSFRDRVLRVRDAVRRGSERSGRPCLYHALLTGPLPELERRLRLLEREGIDGVLVAPMLLGLEATRSLLASTDRLVWTHPSLTGALAHPAGSAMSPAFLHGVLFRLLGADAAIFVNHGGRFPISRDDCVAIAEQLRRPRGAWRPTFPVPAGGMRFDRIDSMSDDFGADTILLIGGDLLVRPEGVERGTRNFLELVGSRFDERIVAPAPGPAAFGTCDLPAGAAEAVRGRLAFLGDFRWEGRTPRAYRDAGAGDSGKGDGGADDTGADFREVTRWELVGVHGEATGYEVRYFEVAPGGATSRERHRHAHTIIGLRGEGTLWRGEDVQDPVAPFDVAYVAPDEPHQLRAGREEPFGFLCIVDRDRDRPRPV